MFPKKITNLLAAGSVAAFSYTSSVSAQRVEPMRYELSPSGSSAQTMVMVTNTRSTPITMEVVVSALSIDDTGTETLTPADDDFLVYPAQTVIEPGASQAFRVRYIGSALMEKSKAYRIGFNQLPIDMREEGETGIGVVTQFGTLANVVPARSASQLEVERIQLGPENRWQLSITNNGNRFARLSEQQVIVRQGDREVRFAGAQTQGWFDKNLVLPGNRLNVTIPAVAGFDIAESKITLVPSG